MIVFIKQWVINIVTLVLFIIMFEMILPTGKMKKYIRLVTSTIMVIVIINPLIGLLDKNVDFTALQTSSSNALEKLQVEKDSELLEDEQMKQIVQVYRQNIIEQIEQNAQEVAGVKQAKADIIFNEDYNSKSFGEIKRAYLEIATTKGDEEGGDSTAVKGGASNDGTGSAATQGDCISDENDSLSIGSVAEVEHVKVGQLEKHQEMDDQCDPQIIKELEEKIGQVFGVKSENIIISQMKR